MLTRVGWPRRSGIVAALLGPALMLLTAACAPSAHSGGEPAGTAQLTRATESDLSFTVDGTTTYGTLQVPAHRRGQHLAAALLLPGSGPTDRDGDQPAENDDPQTLRLIAGVLGQQGIMTLRFDKYFTGQTGAGAYAADPGRIDIGAFIRQADAAYDVLRDQPAADPHALLIVGHSEGGFTAMLVAESVRPHPAGLALLEPQDLRMLDLVRIQLAEQLQAAQAAGQVTASAVARDDAGITRVISEFRAGQPVRASGLPPSVAGLFTGALFSPDNARFTRSDDALYPPAIAARLAAGTRVLVTCGTADTNVPCSTTGPLMTALARAGTTGPGLRVLAGVDHLLKAAGTPVNDAILAPAAISALRAFARPWAQSATQ